MVYVQGAGGISISYSSLNGSHYNNNLLEDCSVQDCSGGAFVNGAGTALHSGAVCVRSDTVA